MLSLVIPVYKNEENLDRLLSELVRLQERIAGGLEVVFVVDGSPDRCHAILSERLPSIPIRAQLLLLSRNFGSFSAIAAGLAYGKGDYFAVLAADLQEPPELILELFALLSNDEADVAFGVRSGRSDPYFSGLFSTTFWRLYRRLVVPDMPPGGVDVFGCNRMVRDRLLSLREVNTNLIALLFWLGYRRRFVSYVRQPRLEGKSAWTLQKKLRYSFDSVFNFTDLPIRILLTAGVLGATSALVIGVVVLVFKLAGRIQVLGYTPLILTITFFGGLTALGLGIIGQYLWLTLENTRQHPQYLVQYSASYHPEQCGE